tara:strand:+ start:463 stop:1323 length:861 start_codon:yes stop_codon:yes gene_type:complete
MSFTLTTLRTALKEYTENTETSFVNNLDLFIRLAEERILKNVQLNVFEKNVSGNMSASNQYLACPSDFLAPNSLTITNSSNYTYLQFKEKEFVQTYTPNPATTGVPRYYAQFDVDNFVIAPTPDSGYTVDLSYFYRPSSLTDSTITLTLSDQSSGSSPITLVPGTITGNTSGAVATVTGITGFDYTVSVPTTSFTAGETVTSNISQTATLSSFTSDTTESWLSTNAELALLYGSLIECYIYMKGDADVMTMYNNRFIEAIARLKNLGEAKEVMDEYTMGPIRKARS